MRRLAILLLVFGTVSLSLYLWWNHGLAAANPADKSERIVVIPQGKGVREIANALKQEGLIRDPVVFFLLVRFRLKVADKIQAGDFRLSASQTPEAIAKQLTHGTLDIWVTVPEGFRADEIADLLKEKIPTYQERWRNVLTANEGYLFPDTYLIPKDATVDLVLSLMRNNFEAKFATIGTFNHKLAKEKVVIVASLVEREAKFPEDRPLVASVILNRLSLGMKLDVDATVQYALAYQEEQKRWWKKGLTTKDLAITSPYNTYRNQGLPPTPIANPGLASLKAVVNPATTNYLYYVSDKSGRNHYAETVGEHNENIKKYGL